MSATRPTPVADELSQPYWDAAARGESVLPRCAACGAFDLPPDVVCGRCGSTQPQWAFEPVSGRGTVRSFTTVRQPFLPGIEVPYVLVDVEVDEQSDLRVIGRLVHAEVSVGARVETIFDDGLPLFRVVAE